VKRHEEQVAVVHLKLHDPPVEHMAAADELRPPLIHTLCCQLYKISGFWDP
jgi:hypothetical protein